MHDSWKKYSFFLKVFYLETIIDLHAFVRNNTMFCKSTQFSLIVIACIIMKNHNQEITTDKVQRLNVELIYVQLFVCGLVLYDFVSMQIHVVTTERYSRSIPLTSHAAHLDPGPLPFLLPPHSSSQ